MTWKGDHPPRHVHVYKDDRLLLKWDLELDQLMSGTITARIRKFIRELMKEGRF